MATDIVYDTPNFLLGNHAGGLAYELTHKPSGDYIYFQGGIATRFREELEAWESSAPDIPSDTILETLWDMYACIKTERNPTIAVKKNVLNALFDDAIELQKAVQTLMHRVPRGSRVYIKLEDGSTLGTARLEEETLSDGSIAYNIILIEDE